jgi:peroxiredoxin
MKKSFLLLLSVIFLISLLVFQSHMKYKEKQDYLTSINRLPEFYYEELYKGKQSSVDLIDGSPFLIIYFDTKCIFCEIEIKKIVRDAKKLGNLKILLLSSELKSQLVDFKDKNLPKNFMVGSITPKEMFKNFHTLVTPSTFVYNKKGIIKSYFKRPIDTKEILAALNDNDN